jgi:hypothetical protein
MMIMNTDIIIVTLQDGCGGNIKNPGLIVGVFCF